MGDNSFSNQIVHQICFTLLISLTLNTISGITDSTWHNRELDEPEQAKSRPDLYQYTKDLTRLETCRTGTNCALLEEATVNTTPLRVSAWEQASADHPDKEFIRYILTGISHGFHISFNGGTVLYTYKNTYMYM